MTVTRWKFTIEYDGTNYNGWQKQIDGVPTIQESIETALFQFCGQTIKITAAGRTDTGVHAKGQVAHFDLDYGARDLSGFNLQKAINALLRPQSISILQAEIVPNDFHARFDAVSKIYRYRIFNRFAPPNFEKNFVEHIYGDLDCEQMQEGANYLIGTHDFTSFRAQYCQAKSPIRSIDSAEILKVGEEIQFMFQGKSFLHHQVRNMVGSLLMIGQKKWEPIKINEILKAKNRVMAGPTAPPQGLCLERIFYPNQ
jgi:tRNA pseudouridine38-40 synthase